MSIPEENPTQILNNVTLGEGVQIYHFVNLYGCTIGSQTRIGSFVEIQKGVEVGERCKIQRHTFICEGVKIGHGVFVGHGVIFINDKHPKATNQQGILASDQDWTMLPTIVEDHVSIGSGAIIMGGIRIGKNAMIGAGAVVTKDVPAGETVLGVPARVAHGKSIGR